MSGSESASSAESSAGGDGGHIPPLVYPALGKHTHTLILLHGRGDKARAFGPQFLLSRNSSEKMLQKHLPGLKVVFPTAKRRSLADHSQIRINQWFDIVELKDTTKREHVQIEGLRESAEFIQELIREEMKLIPCKNIVLGGLSQGCATALYTMLTFEPPKTETGEEHNRLGAVLGMSGWLPFRKAINSVVDAPAASSAAVAPASPPPILARQIEALNVLRRIIGLPSLDTTAPAALSTPVFLGHGTKDETVDVTHGELATSTLRSLGVDVTWTPYKDFHHWYKVPDEIDDLVDFMKKHTGLAGE
jgi:predicted esterase